MYVYIIHILHICWEWDHLGATAVYDICLCAEMYSAYEAGYHLVSYYVWKYQNYIRYIVTHGNYISQIVYSCNTEISTDDDKSFIFCDISTRYVL